MFILIATLLAMFDIAPPVEGDLKPHFGLGLVRCVHRFPDSDAASSPLRGPEADTDTRTLQLPRAVQVQDYTTFSLESCPDSVEGRSDGGIDERC